jgi:hypothetical protein
MLLLFVLEQIICSLRNITRIGEPGKGNLS